MKNVCTQMLSASSGPGFHTALHAVGASVPGFEAAWEPPPLTCLAYTQDLG